MKCLEACKRLGVSCPNEDCRLWISSEHEYNCIQEALEGKDYLTLREVADRMGMSFVRVKQLQDVALNKIKNSFEK